MQKSSSDRFILTDIEHKQLFYDSKTILQEMVQSEDKEASIVYHLVAEEGPDHDKKFIVELRRGQSERGPGHWENEKGG